MFKHKSNYLIMKSFYNRTYCCSNQTAKYFLATCVLFILLLVACTQRRNNKPIIVWSCVSLTNEGITYHDTLGIKTGGGAIEGKVDTVRSLPDLSHFGCTLEIGNDQSTLDFLYHATDSFPYTIQILRAIGPASGVGIYKISKKDMDAVQLDTTTRTRSLLARRSPAVFLTEKNNKEDYSVDSAEIDVTKAAGEDIDATYKLWATQNGAAKSITGTISWHFATIRKSTTSSLQ
jgi:hypothetical protein